MPKFYYDNDVINVTPPQKRNRFHGKKPFFRKKVFAIFLVLIIFLAGVVWLVSTYHKVHYLMATITPPNNIANIEVKLSYHRRWQGIIVEKIYFTNPAGYLEMQPIPVKLAQNAVLQDSISLAPWVLTSFSQSLDYAEIRDLPFNEIPHYYYLAQMQQNAQAYYDPGKNAHLNPNCSFITSHAILQPFDLRPDNLNDYLFCPYCAYR